MIKKILEEVGNSSRNNVENKHQIMKDKEK